MINKTNSLNNIKSVEIVDYVPYKITTYQPMKFNTALIATRLQNKQVNTKTIVLFVFLLLVAVGMFFLSVMVWPSLPDAHFLHFKIGWLLQASKLPGVLVSAIGLSMGGYIVQQCTKNRLADTSILGISTVNIVVLVIVFTCGVGTTVAFMNAQPWVLLLFSVLTGLLIFALSYKRNSNISIKFILAGIIINFLFVGFGNTFMNASYANNPIYDVLPFIDGQLPLPSLTNYDFYCALGMVLFATLWILVISKRFFISNSNFLIAKAVGVKPTPIYFQAIIIASIYAASAFILVGNVTFLGIATGNIAFFIFKKRPISGIFGSILSGVAFMLFSFFIDNNCIADSYIPSSMLIPLIVAPIFVLLALKRK